MCSLPCGIVKCVSHVRRRGNALALWLQRMLALQDAIRDNIAALCVCDRTLEYICVSSRSKHVHLLSPSLCYLEELGAPYTF